MFSPWGQGPASLSHCCLVPSLAQNFAPNPQDPHKHTEWLGQCYHIVYSWATQLPEFQFAFYLIANMSNSQFMEARRKKKATWVYLQSKSAQLKYLSSEDSGIHFYKGKREKPTPFLILSSCIVCKPFKSSLRPRLIFLPQKAHFLVLVVLLSLRKEHSRQENWACPSWGKDVWKSSQSHLAC